MGSSTRSFPGRLQGSHCGPSPPATPHWDSSAPSHLLPEPPRTALLHALEVSEEAKCILEAWPAIWGFVFVTKWQSSSGRERAWEVSGESPAESRLDLEVTADGSGLPQRGS